MARVVLGTETQSAGGNREVAQGGFGIQGLSLWESSGFIAVRHACNLPVSTCAFHNIHCKHVLLSTQAESPQDCLSIFCPLATLGQWPSMELGIGLSLTSSSVFWLNCCRRQKKYAIGSDSICWGMAVDGVAGLYRKVDGMVVQPR